MSAWAPTVVGDSIGHYEGNVLVVAWAPARRACPQSSVRTPTSHSRGADVSSGGWKETADSIHLRRPEIYAKPHTWTCALKQALGVGGGPSYALDDWCDTSDPVERRWVICSRSSGRTRGCGGSGLGIGIRQSNEDGIPVRCPLVTAVSGRGGSSDGRGTSTNGGPPRSKGMHHHSAESQSRF